MTESRIPPELMERLRQGDQEAAREFVERYKDQVCRQIKLLMRNWRVVRRSSANSSDSFESTVESYFNDAYSKLLNQIREGKLTEVLSPVAYMRQIASNRWLAARRKEQRISPSSVENLDAEQDEVTAHEHLVTQELIEKSQLAISLLSAEERTLIDLRIDRKWSFAEIGQHLAKSPHTLRARYSELIRRLRRSLDEVEE